MSEYLENLFRSRILEETPESEEEKRKREEEERSEKRKLLLDAQQVIREEPQDPVKPSSFLENKFKQSVDESAPLVASQELGLTRGNKKPHGFVSGVFDLVSRPLYATTALVDRRLKAITEAGTAIDKVKEFILSSNPIARPQSFIAAAREFFNPQERLLWSDVIRTAAPVWSRINPEATGALGFAGDVVLDPLNFISLGTGGVFKQSLGITTKAGRIRGLTKEGEVVFQKFIDVAAEEGLEGAARYNRATELMSELITPTEIPKRLAPSIKRSLQTSEIEDVQRSIGAAIERQEIGVGQAAFIADEDFIRHIQDKGTLPGSLMPPQGGIVKFSHAGEHGFSVEAVNRIKSGTSFHRISRQGKITPILNTVDAVDVKLNPGEVKVSLNKGGGFTLLDGSPNKLQTKALDSLSEKAKLALTDDTSKLSRSETFISELARKQSRVLRGQFIHNVDFNPLNIKSKPRKGKVPIGVVVPRDSILGVSRKTKDAFIDSTIDPQKLWFTVPGRDGLLKLNEVADIIKLGDLSPDRNIIKDLRKIQAIGKKVTDDLQISRIESLIDQGGLKIFGKSVLTSEDFKNFAASTGLSRVIRLIDELPATEELEKITNKLHMNVDLTGYLEKHFPEWMRRRRGWEAQRFETLRNAHGAYASIFDTVVDGKRVKSLTEAEKVEITNVLTEIQQKTKAVADDLGIEANVDLGQKIFQETIDLYRC